MFRFQADLSRRQEKNRFFSSLIGYFWSWWVFWKTRTCHLSYHAGKSRTVPRKQGVACGCFCSLEQIMGVEGEHWEFGEGFKRHHMRRKKEAGLRSRSKWCPSLCVGLEPAARRCDDRRAAGATTWAACHSLQRALKRDGVHHVPTSAAADAQRVARLQVRGVKVLSPPYLNTARSLPELGKKKKRSSQKLMGPDYSLSRLGSLKGGALIFKIYFATCLWQQIQVSLSLAWEMRWCYYTSFRLGWGP